ncbi:hypothetical protein E3E12_02280 [Formicincola oecophyllae]|uniref:Lipoprotein n=1 Tax=Formicincola oecophyllae TaxID=2558361 RepID=A0A4Y6U9J5_9PROT|nr:hypothetical protein [Formicincola oecophyllae]QDH13218.1 hypothetical protein E3E12_02280 [Formicincola oecophyllae]
MMTQSTTLKALFASSFFLCAGLGLAGCAGSAGPDPDNHWDVAIKAYVVPHVGRQNYDTIPDIIETALNTQAASAALPTGPSTAAASSAVVTPAPAVGQNTPQAVLAQRLEAQNALARQNRTYKAPVTGRVVDILLLPDVPHDTAERIVAGTADVKLIVLKRMALLNAPVWHRVKGVHMDSTQDGVMDVSTKGCSYRMTSRDWKPGMMTRTFLIDGPVQGVCALDAPVKMVISSQPEPATPTTAVGSN